jgi:hypothetical protein
MAPPSYLPVRPLPVFLSTVMAVILQIWQFHPGPKPPWPMPDSTCQKSTANSPKQGDFTEEELLC